ncbi:MAG: IclR family transcriptional regulator [Caulobacterales bacterium]|uniref:IclR family transcriptional regulator n=1 Tax=Glycocaulis sp. TaxID=1969725 RepID=UPI003F9FF8B9
MTSRREGIQSVGTGLRVLRVLAALDGPAGLGVIARAAGLSSPQAHRYLVSLTEAGMARQLPGDGRYDLGPGALELALGALSRVDAFSEADAALARFRDETGRTVQLAALGPNGPVIVRWFMGVPPVVTALAVGSRLPLLRSATGHVFLAYREPQETGWMVEEELRTTGVSGGIDVEALRASTRKTGYSSVSETLIPGLRASAVPILDLQGRAALVATLLANSAVSEEDEARDRAALADACRAISRSIGGSGI